MLAAIALAAIAIATLTPRPPELPLPRMLGVVSGEMELQDFLANIVLFVPFGLGIGLAAARTRRAVLVALAVSALIEVTQEFFIPGRDASVADIVANVIGGTIGGWIGAHARMLARPSRAEARVLAAAGTLGAAIVFACTAWLIAPGAPSAQYEGQFAQHWVPHHGVPLGVLDATINGMPFRWDLITVTDDVNRGLRAGRLRLDARLIPGAPFDGRSRLVRVIEHEHVENRPLVALFADGRDLLFSARTRADGWQLRSPWVRVRNAFPARGPDASHAAPADWAARLVAGRDTIVIGGERDGGTMRAWARGRTGQSEAVVALTPAIGWMLLTPVGATPTDGETILSVLWVALVAGAPLYWLTTAIVSKRALSTDNQRRL